MYVCPCVCVCVCVRRYKALADDDALAAIVAQNLGPRWTSCGLDDVAVAVELEAGASFDKALEYVSLCLYLLR